MSGFIAVSRDLWDDPEFADAEMSQREAFIFLIAEASWKPRKKRIGCRVIDLERGQLAASTRFLARAFQWSESRVRRYLKVLQSRSIIDAAIDAGVTVITICNYDKYQSAGSRTDAPSDAAPTHERRSTDANYNKGNKDNKVTKDIPARENWRDRPVDERRELFDQFFDAHPDPQRRGGDHTAVASFNRLISSGTATAEQLILAMSAYAKSQKAKDGFSIAAHKFLDTGEWKNFLPKPKAEPLGPVELDPKRAEHRFLLQCREDGAPENFIRSYSKPDTFRLVKHADKVHAVVSHMPQRFCEHFARTMKRLDVQYMANGYAQENGL